jgi:hypothetical protein
MNVLTSASAVNERPMRNVAFTLVSELPMTASLQKVMRLFDQEAVRYETTDCSVRSTKVPFAVFTLDPRMYSRRNWLGLNPFVFASRVVVTARKGTADQTVLDVTIDRRRAIVMYTLSMANVLVVGAVLPTWWAGLALVAFFAAVLFLFFFRFSSSEIGKEIRTAIQAS